MNTAAEVSSFGTEKLSKLMLKFSIPCVLSLLVSALYNIVDQIFIGNSELSTLGNARPRASFSRFSSSRRLLPGASATAAPHI